MTTTKTADVDGTLAQVYALASAGADIVRITCNDVDAATGLRAVQGWPTYRRRPPLARARLGDNLT